MLIKEITLPFAAASERGSEMTDLQKTELYREFHGKVLGYIQNKVNHYQQAEDLCSEVFLKVYEKIDTFDEQKASLSTWIFTITRNTVTDHFRTRHVHDEIPETMPASDDIEESVCRGEMLDMLAAALKTLDERERDIIVLRYYSGMQLKSIAEKMDISYSYAKVLQNKALSALKKFFA